MPAANAAEPSDQTPDGLLDVHEAERHPVAADPARAQDDRRPAHRAVR
jgi:hypothetical protein